MSNRTELITYASTKEDINEAIKNGATHLILEDPNISLRSWIPPRPFDSFKALSALIHHLKNQHPTIGCSINCDILLHQSHNVLIEELIQFSKEHPIDYIRVQDLGLLHLLNKETKTAIIYSAEMGNNNWVGIDSLSKKATRQVLSLDLAHGDIKEINKHCNTDLEVQVQGPILIQYSRRRFLSEPEQSDALTQIHKIAEDEDYPGRRFTFLDTPHGHFMYAYFDRCLLSAISQLKDCQLKGWIIDGRGESKEYLKVALSHYKRCLQENLDKEACLNLKANLSESATRLQKPGFFMANQTDRRRYKNRWLPNNYEKVGQVLDVIKGKTITIECQKSFRKGDQLIIFHPKMEDVVITAGHIKDLNGNPLNKTSPEQLIQLPWFKGIQQQSILAKKT